MSALLDNSTQLFNWTLIQGLMWWYFVNVVISYTRLTLWRLPWTMWVGFIQSVHGLKSKNVGFPGNQKFCLQTAMPTPEFPDATLPYKVQTRHLLYTFKHISLYKINTSISIYIYSIFMSSISYLCVIDSISLENLDWLRIFRNWIVHCEVTSGGWLIFFCFPKPLC